MSHALVYGLAVAGESVVRALQRRGVDVLVVDDATTPPRDRVAADLDVELVVAPSDDALERMVRQAAFVSPSPGVPETHRVVDVARRHGVAVLSEIELAYCWEQERAGGPRPMLAVTGTDGKTTTTLLAVDMLRAAGLRTVDAGNTATPLVAAIDLDLDVFVVECTSFRLAWTPTFRAEAAAWLNLAPDHLDWHRSIDTYEAAKAQVFANQRPTDVAIGFADDEAVMRRVRSAPGRGVSFGLGPAADYHLDGEVLTGPSGPIVERSRMRRSLPHDVTNALAASALVMETGLAGAAAVGDALESFVGPPHRLEAIGEWDDVAWFNDSKATTPHAAAAAVRAFDRLILIAGGKDKHVDLAPMAAEPDRVRAIVAIGATREAVAELFRPHAPVRTVEHLREAVAIAAELAEPGDTVLLSPGCSSLDQYPSFEARGDEFRRLVHDLHKGDQP